MKKMFKKEKKIYLIFSALANEMFGHVWRENVVNQGLVFTSEDVDLTLNLVHLVAVEEKAAGNPL